MPLTFQLSPKEAVYMRGIEFEVMARNPFSRSLWKIYQWQMSNKEHLLRLHASHTSAIRAHRLYLLRMQEQKTQKYRLLTSPYVDLWLCDR